MQDLTACNTDDMMLLLTTKGRTMKIDNSKVFTDDSVLYCFQAKEYRPLGGVSTDLVQRFLEAEVRSMVLAFTADVNTIEDERTNRFRWELAEMLVKAGVFKHAKDAMHTWEIWPMDGIIPSTGEPLNP